MPCGPSETKPAAERGRRYRWRDLDQEGQMTTMKALVQDIYGSAEVLQLREIDQPTAGDGEVLVRVHAAGISRGDLHLMYGEPYLVRLLGYGLRRPKNPVPGQDVAGTVAAIGANVTRFRVGDEVFGIARGSFAEYAVAREVKLAHKPTGLSYEHAAAMPISGLTALRAVDTAGIGAGQTVLVVGASGGVGTYAVQLAVAAGATVTGVASTSKVRLVQDLGATEVIDYTKEDFAAGSRTFDVVLDIGGATPLRRLRRALRRTGTLAIVGGENGSTWSPGMGRQLHALLLNPFVAQRLVMVMNREHFSGLQRLADLAEKGSITSFTDRTFSLADTADAIEHLAAGRARGKLVVTV
jgi:NADPH:quinone reductase-like Zn-dependent oxidoreductase